MTSHLDAAIKTCLKELLRLYDLRAALGELEKDPQHNKELMRRDLLRYGREKKAAWDEARKLLT